MKTIILMAPLPPSPGGIAGWAGRMLNTEYLDDWNIIPIDEKLIGKRRLFFDEKPRLFSELKRSIKIWVKLISYLRINESIVVHICIPPSYGALLREFVSIKICHAYKKKVIVHFRSTIPNIVKNNHHISLYKNTLRSADFVIFLNQISASYIEDIDSSKYDIIPNFIENMECKSHIINKVVKTCIYTGGVIPEKGCDTIIEIAKKYPQISFRMCGIVNDSISSKHIPDNVVLLGHLSKEKIYSELKNADLFIFLSRFRGEGFSNSLLEAMALGLPCFVSDWASNRDMIEDKGGLVVPADDLNSILANFESMINLSPERRQAMSDWNIYKVKEYYTEEIIVKRYKEIYEAIH